MASSSQSTAHASSVAALEPFRDAGGMLPLVACHKCGTQFISRVSQKIGSKGKRFYKCPLLEHTDYKCGVYMFEDEYVEYLVQKGILPRSCSWIRSTNLVRYEAVKNEPSDMTLAVEEVEKCTRILQGIAKDAEASFKDATDCKVMMCNKIDRVGERLLFIGLANLVVVVLVLLVLLFK